MRQAVLVSTARTPIGKAYRGAFNNTQAQELAAQAITHAVRRAGLDGGEVEDVILGCAAQQGSSGMNIARQAVLRAGLPETVPGMTIDRQWPREVEDVLYRHPAVREAAVVGVPDPYRGETVAAFVSLRPGGSVEPEELVAYCRDHLAAYKAPRKVSIRDELPKTTSGKILRRELRGAASA
jgi:hypothetical protein